MSGTQGHITPKPRPMWAGKATTNASGVVIFTFPVGLLGPFLPIVTVSFSGSGSDLISHRVTSLSAAVATILVLKQNGAGAPVPAPDIPVMIIATVSG